MAAVLPASTALGAEARWAVVANGMFSLQNSARLS